MKQPKSRRYFHHQDQVTALRHLDDIVARIRAGLREGDRLTFTLTARWIGYEDAATTSVTWSNARRR